MILRILITILLPLGITIAQDESADTQTPMSAAVLNFQSKGDDVEGAGEKVGVLLTAFLSTNEKLLMVERSDLKDSLDEFEMSLSGVVSNDSAVKIGQLTGAKVIITGKVFPVGKQNYIVAKVIGVETSRVFGETAKYSTDDELDAAITGLSEKVATIIDKNRKNLVGVVETEEQRIERLKKLIGEKGKGKKIYVKIPEQHITRAIPDPAAETEMLMTFQELGFDLTENRQAADIQITGEAFSERAAQRGQLISCRARVEIKRYDSDGELISIDRQTEVAVDLAENIAAKSALQKAGEILAERLVVALSKE